MKRILFIFMLFMAILPMAAQNKLNVHQKDGQIFSFGFEEKPVVTFTDNELVLTSAGAEARFQLVEIAKFTFDEEGTAVQGIKDDSGKAAISLDEYCISLTGAKPETEVRLIASDGKVLQSYKTDRSGYVQFCIAELPVGSYIISSESLNVKIMKK